MSFQSEIRLFGVIRFRSIYQIFHQNGQTALHLALARGHIEIALLLLSRGCQPGVQDQAGDTPLHVAAERGLASAVQSLCQLGTPVDVQNSVGKRKGYFDHQSKRLNLVKDLKTGSSSVRL